MIWYFIGAAVILAAAAVGLLLYLTACAARDEKTELRLRPFIGSCFAHKGLYQNNQSIPENSMPAFRGAVLRGIGIDCDVQRTWDGKAVCFCDTHMRAACGIDERMVSFNYEHIAQLKLYGTDEHMPLLSDVLKLVNGRVPMIIEVKSPAGMEGISVTCETIYEVIKDYEGPYCIASFDPHVLKWFRKNAPDVLRMQASMPYFEWRESDRSVLRCFYKSRFLFNAVSRPHMIAYGLGTRNFGLRLALRGGTPLLLYTNNRQHRHEELMHSCDMLVFEGYLPESHQRI